MNAAMKVFDRELALQRAGGNEQLAAELFGMLQRELPGQAQRIRSALDERDYPQLQHLVHKLNGSATYCGVPALKAAADDLETQLKRAIFEHADRGVAIILGEIDRILALPA